MKTTVNTRLSDLLIKTGLDAYSLAKKSGIEYTTINRILSGETQKPSKSTIKPISDALGVNFDYLYLGQMPIYKSEAVDDPWKNVAFQQIAGERDSLKKEVERLWQMISHYTSGTKPNFHQALNLSGLPGKKGKLLRAAA